MDLATQRLMAGAAGAGGGGVYVDDVFNINTYHGTGVSNRTITTGIDIDGDGGMVIIKKRTGSADWFLSSTNTAASTYVRTNEDGGEVTSATGFWTGFTSTGFTINDDGDVNGNGADYSAYTFKKSPGFFDTGRYVGNGVNHRSISHNLETQPHMLWIKRVSGASDWIVFSRWWSGSPHGKHMHLNNALLLDNSGYMSSTPSSTAFVLSPAASETNANGETYEYYAFGGSYPGSYGETFGADSDAAIQRFFSYTGSSSAQHIDVGFEPQFVMIKNVDDTGDDWIMIDSQAGTSQSYGQHKFINDSGQESTTDGGTLKAYFTNKGFYLPNGNEQHVNKTNDKYIYWAIRKADGIVGKPIADADQAFEMSYGSNGTGFPDTPYFETKNSNNNNLGWKVDTAWTKKHTTTEDWEITMRAMNYGGFGNGFQSNNGQGSNNVLAFDYMNGWNHRSTSNSDYISYMWKHHKGHDSFIYEGSGSQQNISHSLGQAPEWIIVKSLGNGREWITYHAPGLGNNQYMKIDNGNTTNYSNVMFGSGEPLQQDHFVVNTDTDTNQSGYFYHVQMFASVSGISKVGVYTGTGGSHQLDLGFQPRFMITKAKSGSKYWMIQDTLNGWLNNQGNSKVLVMTDNGGTSVPAQLVSYPISTGVQFAGGDWYGNFNTNGTTYLYYAHA